MAFGPKAALTVLGMPVGSSTSSLVLEGDFDFLLLVMIKTTVAVFWRDVIHTGIPVYITDKQFDSRTPTMVDSTTKPLLGQAATALQGLARPLGNFITLSLPLVIEALNFAYQIYKRLPQNAITFLIGTIFCFFGGLFPALFAAVEAAEHAGYQMVMVSVKDLADEAMIIIKESKKDDAVDDNKDGIPDVEQISGREYTIRKTKLVLKKMNPEKVSRVKYEKWLGFIGS